MAYDGLVNYTIVSELKKHILNGKIDKIYEPNFDEIILGIYSNSSKYALDLVVNSKFYRANLTTNAKPNPNQAPNFCMTLRKYLVGSHIKNIYTHGLERIIFIEIEGYNKSKDFSCKTLVIELMGKHSNIILLDNEKKIIDSLKHFSINSGSHRDIFSGAKYVMPKSDKIDFTDISDNNEFYMVLKNNSVKFNNTSLIYILSNVFTGISKSSIKSFEIELDISDDLNIENSNLLFDYITQIIKQIKPVILKNNSTDYYLALSSTTNESVNFSLDDYYTGKETNYIFTNYRDNLLKLILTKLNKLNIKLDSINNKINECNVAENFKLYGELITSNLYRINDYNQKEIILENYYDNNSLIKIPLDESIPPSANAKKFFKKYKKLKTAKEFVNSQKIDLIKNIDYYDEIIKEIEKCHDIFDLDRVYDKLENNFVISKKTTNDKKINKKFKAQYKISNNIGEPLKFEIDSYTVLVGKNNKQNDYLTTKLANKNDLWFHVKDFHGSHVILRTNNSMPSQETINKCAKLAKEYSQANMSSNIVVDYTFIKYVKKPAGSSTGMVIYTNNKSVTVK